MRCLNKECPHNLKCECIYGLRGMECADRISETEQGASAPVDSQSAGSLATKWRKLADSWIAATKGMDVDDDCRIRAEARAEAFLECADQLEANVTGEPSREKA